MDDLDLYDDTRQHVFTFEACKTGHPDDHWYRTPLCQRLITTDRFGDPCSPRVCGDDDWVFEHNDIVNEDVMHLKHEMVIGDPLTDENTRRRNDCRGYEDHSYESEWRVAGPLDPLDGEQLYWSNEQGWVDKASADVFINRVGDLPDEGRWEQGDYTRRPDDKCECRCHWGTYYVNVYEVDRQWGGPEEGGWWYDSGEPVASTPFETLREAEAFRDVMEARFPNDGSSSSVIYSGGDYRAYIEHRFAESWPKHVPHYE